jgi:fatty-acyl-CoA synthase
MKGWYNETITSALDKVARRNPAALAIVQGDQRLTYEELLGKAAGIASGLRKLGIAAGEHVGIFYPNDMVVPILHYASACLGTVCVPINIMVSPQELRHLLIHADISVLFVGRQFKNRHVGEYLLRALPELAEGQGTKVAIRDLPKLKWIIQADGSDPFHESFLSLPAVEETGATDPLPFVNRAAQPENVSHMLYTSGSTALPKGVLLTHRGVLGGAYYRGKAYPLTSKDRCLLLPPLYHTYGLIVLMMCIHLRGGRLYLLESYDPLDPQEVLETIERERITLTNAFDVLLRRILEHPKRPQYDLSSWQKAGAFPGPSYDLRARAGIRHLSCAYSLTEGSNPVSLVMPEEKRSAIRQKSNGRPLPGVDVKIVNPESGQVLPPGVSGEIAFRGWNRFVGYYKPGPEEVPEKIFDKDGYFKTGDRGYLDEEGNLYFQGRYKEVIKTGGENVSSLEIETFLLSEVPGIAQAQVVGIADEQWGEAVTAFIEVKPGKTLTQQQILQICREKLAAFKVPKHLFFKKEEDWPVTSTGKIWKDELRRQALNFKAREISS